jgi:ubiquinone/menaquinone biosynthesis C-methylase UbiE
MNRKLQISYDLVAEDYAKEFGDELERKPFDREMIERLIDDVGDRGIICDLGCGPGHIARYLSDHGEKACGIDISAGMVEAAKALNPRLEFSQGDMLALTGVPDNSFGGIAAFYSIVHIARPQLSQAFTEMIRVLRPGGTLLLAFHIGDQTVEREAWYGKRVALEFYFFDTEEIKTLLQTAGFERLNFNVREPYPEEYMSMRAYVFAEKPEQ